ncbi:MAG: hypothetical protein LOX97_04075 [Sphingomonas sp.]|nr:hypothetical protein [Sphingomonas sp.]
MATPNREQLISRALEVLEEVAALSRHAAPEHSRGIGLALGFLAHVSGPGERWPFDEFWRAMRADCRVARPARLSAALSAIYARLERNRDLDLVSAFQERANAIHGPPEGFPR